MSKPLVMYDAAGENFARVPSGGDAYAGYLGDSLPSIANFSKVVQKHFGKAHCVSIGIRKETLCALLDVEPGNPVRTPQDVRFSFNHRKGNGMWRPGFYADRSDMDSIVIPGLEGIPRHEYRLVVAIPGAKSIPPGFDGVQCALNVNRIYDKSLLRPDFFPEPIKKKHKVPVPAKPHPKISAATIAGGLVTGLLGVLQAHGIHAFHLTATENAAIATVAAVLAGYLKRDKVIS